MKLRTLLYEAGCRLPHEEGDPEIKGIAYDSRLVQPGFIFFALRGQRLDGNQFIPDAIERGAAAIVSDAREFKCQPRAVFVPVPDVRRAMATIACSFFGHPSRAMQMVGITGTNGKTTIAFMLRTILSMAGRRTGMIGTIRYEVGDRSIPAQRTTPESPDLQNLLAQMVRVPCAAAVMEVSSHALVQQRVLGIEFDTTIFTNLTQDHLDYHGNMEDYFKAKSLLFPAERQKKHCAVINADDQWGKKLASAVGSGRQLLTYGVSSESSVRVLRLELNAEGSKMEIDSQWGRHEIFLRLLGRFNVSNALAAFASACALGVDPETAARALSKMDAVPGRLQKIEAESGFTVFVDYAHTADALENVLTTLREIASGRLIVVFGCGGNRDRKKRPLMGEAVSRLADYAILTSDNPRKEKPADIISEIEGGFKDRAKYEVVEDRKAAIAKGLEIAREGDIILIAGKGHENYQEMADRTIPFDDAEVVRLLLRDSGT